MGEGTAQGELGCPLHPGLVEWMRDERNERKEVKAKLDKLIEIQAFHHEEVVTIKSIVSNGLKTTTEQTASDVRALCSDFSTICKNYDDKFEELDKFKWFRDWINDLRNHIFKKVCFLFIFVVIVLAVIHSGGELVEKVIKIYLG